MTLFEDKLAEIEARLRRERAARLAEEDRIEQVALRLLRPVDGAVRQTDPETSHEAAEDGELKVSDRVHTLAVHFDNPGGLTDYELADIMTAQQKTSRIVQQNSCGKRRFELMDEDLIMNTKVKLPAPSGRPCFRWAITDDGMAVYWLYKKWGVI